MSEETLDDRARDLVAAIEVVGRRGPKPGSIWRHQKGGVYSVVCCAVEEATLAPVVVYREAMPKELGDASNLLLMVWTRPLVEFLGGRFNLLSNPPE